MKNACRVKGIDFNDFSKSLFNVEWCIKDLPFDLRANDLGNVNMDKLPIKFEDNVNNVLLLDKITILNQVLGKLRQENLRHLNIILNPTIKSEYANSAVEMMADAVIIRHNRIFLIQFAYDMLSNVVLQDVEEMKVKYTLKEIGNVIKKHLPEDTVVSTALFTIREDNKRQVALLTNKIEKFFHKTTNRELAKLFE